MVDNQQQLDPNDPVAIRFRQLRGGPAIVQAAPEDQLDPNDPIAVRFQQLKGGQTATPPPAPAPVGGLDPNDPIAIRFRQLRGEPQTSTTSDDESDRMGEGQSWVTKPLTTSLLGWGEYRQGATGIEKGAEKFASGLLSPLSVGLMVITGGLGGIAEAGASTAGEEAVTSLAGRAGESLLSSLTPEVAAKVATASGVASKLANAGFTGQQIVTLAEQAPQFKDALAAGDYDKAEELGTSMLLGGTLAALSTAHLVKSISPSNEPVWTQDKDVIAASQQPVREAGARALEFRQANEPLIRNKPLDMAAQLYHEAGGDSDVLERWRQEVVDDNNIKPAIQQKYDFLLRQAQNLPAEVQQLSAQLRLDYAQNLDELKQAGKYDPAKPGDPNYAGQHQYVPDDEGASGLKAPGSSVRRLTKSPALTKPRSFDTIVEALKAGYEPKDIGLAGAREIYIRDLGGMRGAVNAEKEVLGQTADDNRPVGIDPARIRIINGKEVIPVQPGSKVGDVAEQRAPAPQEVSGTVRPEDVLRRVAGTGDIKTAVFKEGASDLEIQNLRDAYAAGEDIKPVEITLDKDGNVIDSEGLHRAYAAQQAGVERVPYIVRRLADERDLNVNPVPGKWPDEIDPITDKEIIGRAVAQVTGRANDTFDDLDAKTQGRVVRRALDMKVAEKTQNSSTATAVRKPSLQPTPKVIVKNGKMYWDVSDYKSGPDVFNRFRFRAADQNGDPIFERANVKVHPDYHKPIMQAFQDTSWFRQNPIMRLALGSSVQAKKLLLSFSPFHWTTEYLRGVQMGLTPIEALNPKELTPDRLAVRSKYGPTLGVEDQRALAAEGAAGSSPLLHKLPLGVGKFLAASEEKLFGGGGYIDRLKADTFDKVTAQIGQRHPNWSTDQVHFASSKIVDSAFGGLNWKMLGASMNSVDALRLIALAPDFTGSQILFAKYGMQPGGSVVGQSLMRIALYNFGVARVLNLLTTGQLHTEHPFAVVSPDEKKLFSIRTMPQDILHALTDPRQFTYNRMNPLLVRGAIEGITGKDEQGKQVTYQKELHDLFRNVLPISSQNFIPGFRREGEGIGSQVLRGAGLTSEPNTTTAFKLAAQLASNRGESGPVDQDKLDRHQYVIQMEDSLRAGAAGIGDLNTAIEHDLLSKDEVKQIAENFKVTQGMSDYDARLYTRASRLPIKDALAVYDVATPQEKKMLQPLLQKKGAAFLKKAQDSMTASARANDPTYQRLRRALPNVALW